METVPERLLDTCLLAEITSKYPARTLGGTFRSPDATWAPSRLQRYQICLFIPASACRTFGSDAVPSVGKPTTEYAGFLDAPMHRPLLATSGAKEPMASHADWGKGVPSESDANRLWPQFERLIPVIDDCRVDSRSEPVPSDGRPARREDLAIAAAWVDRRGDTQRLRRPEGIS